MAIKQFSHLFFRYFEFQTIHKLKPAAFDFLTQSCSIKKPANLHHSYLIK